MIEIFFVSQLCSKKKIDELLKKNKIKPLQSIQGYSRRLVHGLKENGAKVSVLSSLPIKTGDYKKGIIRKSRDEEDGIAYEYAPIWNFKIIRRPFLFVYYFFKVLSLKRGTICVCDILCQTISFATYLGCRIKKNKCIAIVTDRPEDVLGNKSIAYKIQSKFDGYVFLTEAMNDNINIMKKPFVVVEAICPDVEPHSKTSGNKHIMYAGGLYEKYGVKQLLEAFEESGVKDDGWELHLYGQGDILQEEYNIVGVFYHGIVQNEEILKEEEAASLLVNPRRNNGEYTKYSFPSKIIEYLASGTPVLMYRLDGIPKEYDNYIYYVDGDSMDDLADMIKKLINRPQKDLDEFGKKAREWVLENKNAKVQAKKVMELINANK